MKLKCRWTAHQRVFLQPGKMIFILCLFVPAVFLPAACASGGRTEPGDTGTITGKISVKGSEPKTFVALTTEAGTVYEITGPLTDRLAEDYQYSTVILEGKLIRAYAGAVRGSATDNAAGLQNNRAGRRNWSLLDNKFSQELLCSPAYRSILEACPRSKAGLSSSYSLHLSRSSLR